MNITINSDLGESFGIHSFGNDEALLALIDLANVACGMHAGDPSTMAKTVRSALEHGVRVGAHPGLPDLVGFGRRQMVLDPVEVRDLVRYQVGALTGFLDAEGASLHHIKPHGALFGMASRQDDVMDAICDVAIQYGVPVLGLAGTAHERVAVSRGVELIPEFYVDLDYADDGSLLIARSGSARDPDQASERARRAIVDHRLRTVGGNELTVRVSSLCLHSDVPNAPEVAARVRQVVNETAPFSPDAA